MPTTTLSSPASPVGLSVRIRLLLLMLVVGVVSVLAYLLISQQKTEDAHQHASQQLRFYRQSLSALLAKLDQFPQLLAQDQSLHVALAQPRQPAALAAANQALAKFRQITGVSDAYLLDTTGLTIAASNTDPRSSFVGRRFDYRPYYREALSGKLARFYGMGTTTHIPGYYLASPVRQGNRIVGIAVVKTVLSHFETQLRESGQPLFVIDSNGIINLTSVNDWSYTALFPLSPAQQAQIRSSRQYPTDQLPLWAGRPLLANEWASGTLNLQPLGQAEGQYQLLSEQVGILGWQMFWVSNLKPAADAAAQQAALIGLGLFLLGFALIYRQERLQTLRYRKQEAARLAEAIASRTEQLASTNRALQETITDLQATRHQWQQAQEKSVQTAKMALLGQLSSGLAHEINQPLAALMTLADNAQTLLARQQPDMAAHNLAMISQTAERMSELTRQLKHFARQAPLAAQPVLVGESLRHAVQILAPRLHLRQMHLSWPPLLDTTLVMAEVTPLSQVMVNLIVNALDAMKHLPAPRIEIDAIIEYPIPSAADGSQPGELHLTLRDIGTGLDPRVSEHLFEPFFTTKPSGEGLGLGLVISQAIIAGFNGQFALYNHPDKGTVASIRLPLAPTNPSATPAAAT